MPSRRLLAALAAAPLLLAGCAAAAGEGDTTSTPTTTAATTTSPSSTTATPAATSEEPILDSPAAPSEKDGVQTAAAPTVVECLYGGDSWTTTAFMSDGTVQWAAECQKLRDDQLAAYPYRCPGTDHPVTDPSLCESNRPREMQPPQETQPLPEADTTPVYDNITDAQAHSLCHNQPGTIKEDECAALDAKYDPKPR